jgi:AraC-like DNA-binding protein
MLLEDCHLGHFFIGISHFLGRPLPALYVVTRDPEHVNLSNMHWSTRVPVEFGCNSGIAFPRALLGASRQMNLEEDSRWGAVQRWLDFAEPDPALEISPLANIKLLKAGPSGNTASVGDGAPMAGFRSARQQIIVDAAIRILTNTRDSVESIAAQLGYSEARSFRRFMKGATGRTPDQIRSGFGIPVRNLLVHERYRRILAQIPG